MITINIPDNFWDEFRKELAEKAKEEVLRKLEGASCPNGHSIAIEIDVDGENVSVGGFCCEEFRDVVLERLGNS